MYKRKGREGYKYISEILKVLNSPADRKKIDSELLSDLAIKEHTKSLGEGRPKPRDTVLMGRRDIDKRSKGRNVDLHRGPSTIILGQHWVCNRGAHQQATGTQQAKEADLRVVVPPAIKFAQAQISHLEVDCIVVVTREQAQKVPRQSNQSTTVLELNTTEW